MKASVAALAETTRVIECWIESHGTSVSLAALRAAVDLGGRALLDCDSSGSQARHYRECLGRLAAELPRFQQQLQDHQNAISREREQLQQAAQWAGSIRSI
jgi:hypothetical protein